MRKITILLWLATALSGQQFSGSSLKGSLTPGRGNTVVLFGDSITLRNCYDGASASSTEPCNDGYWVMGQIFSGQKWRVIHNAGIGGDTTALMLARIQTDVIAWSPNWVMVMGGINDLNVTPVATIESNLLQIYTTILASGSKLMISSITPDDNYNSTGKTAYGIVDTWIKAYAVANPTVLFADMGNNCRTSIPNPVFSDTNCRVSDGVHPTAYMASLMGVTLANAIASFTGAPSAYALPTTNPSPWNLLANPLMSGTGGTLAGTGSVAGVAASWTVDGNGTAPTVTKVARVDGNPGEWQQISRGTVTNGSILLYQPITIGWSVGDTIQATAEYQVDSWANMHYFQGYLVLHTGGVDVNYWSSFEDDANSQSYLWPSGVMQTRKFVIPPNTTAITFFTEFFGNAAVYRIGRCEVRKFP